MRTLIQRHGVTVAIPLAMLMLGVGATVYLYHRGRLAPLYTLSFTYTKIAIATPEFAASSPLRMFASVADHEAQQEIPQDDLVPVENLVAVKISVRNKGPRPVRQTDYESPLELTPVKGARVLSSALGETSRPDLSPELTLDPRRASIRIEPVVLESRDHFAIDLIVADDPDASGPSSPLTLSGHIVAVADYELATAETMPRSAFQRFLGILGFAVGIAIALYMVAWAVGLDVMARRYWIQRGQTRAIDTEMTVNEVHELARSAQSGSQPLGQLMTVAHKHPVAPVRAAAVENLGYLVGAHYVIRRVSEPVVGVIRTALESDPEADVRAAALVALRQIQVGHKTAAVTALGTRDPDERVRWLAALGTQEPAPADTQDWSQRYSYTERDVKQYAPTSGGVYRLIYTTGGDYYVFYVGHSEALDNRLLGHLTAAEPNSCIGRRVRRYPCFFRFLKVASAAERDRIAKQQIQKFDPSCSK